MRRRAFVLLNRTVNAVVRRVRPRRFRGARLLYLTTTGRTTGTARTTPLAYLPDGDRWIVVASNGGADWEPGWWLNLRAGTSATIEVDGVRAPVVGTEVTGPERDVLWRRLNDEVLDYAAYQAKVSRRIAVVALTATADR
ncbi:nitroreductase/quinone reductase family protein [uncultured Cellulomonas sp.]|uniref:nitroreductase/quinone reductase family protein n=1 Tax=uncultured Cellulomonas sp. TaxID=189682 RepID=UPI002618C0FE|nr:nitroreductase/quinone reductase family protein [uncultured Cellulomonas sp.]